jgi:hypothetical protein
MLAQKNAFWTQQK